VDKNGIVIVDDLRKKINEETSLISVIYINNETGAVQPIDKIVEVKNSINKDIVLHVDAVQAYGKIRIAPEKQGIDLLTMSSHKIHGPRSWGFIYPPGH